MRRRFTLFALALLIRKPLFIERHDENKKEKKDALGLFDVFLYPHPHTQIERTVSEFHIAT